MLIWKAWLPLGGALVAGGLIWGNSATLALGIFLLLGGGFARWWADRALVALEFERWLPETRAFPGEHLSLTYRLTNRKLLMLPRVELTDQLPDALAPERLLSSLAGVQGSRPYSKVTSVGGHRRAAWSLELPCRERGLYRLGPGRIRSGDGFGLFMSGREEAATVGVVVYPRVVSLPDLGLPAARPLGERSGGMPIFEDPLRIRGLRDYESGDSIRRIDWKATARRGQLQSRVYEPSTTQHLIVALNIDTRERAWEGYVPALLESSITVTASVARWAFEARYAVGLLANGSLPESDRRIWIPPGWTTAHQMRILEALGAIAPITLVSLSDVLEQESYQLPFGATLAVVSSIMTDPLVVTLHHLHDSGHRVVVLALTDDDWAGRLDPVLVQRVSPATVPFVEATI